MNRTSVARLRRVGNGPDFEERFTRTTDDLPPLRAYLHCSYGFAFCTTVDKMASDHARDYLVETFRQNTEIVSGSDFLLAAVWGDDEDKMVDLFTFSDIQEWPGNPDVSAYVFKNGMYMPERKVVTCGDTLIVLGAEERHRRSCSCLEDYIGNAPEIEGLERW